MTEKHIKPPIGLIPKEFVEENRFRQVCAAIARYFASGLKIDPEWIEEYNEFKDKKQQTIFIHRSNGDYESYEGKQLEEVLSQIEEDGRYSDTIIWMAVPMVKIDENGNKEYL